MATSVAAPSAPIALSKRKSLKGVIALAAAGLLLSGGAGTFALWSDSVTLDGGNVNSGQLKLTNTQPGGWYDLSSGTAAPIADISAFQVVPGDVIEYRVESTIAAEGENLQATLAADPVSVTGDPELLADMDVATAITVGGTAQTALTEADNNKPVDVAVTFDFDDASLNATQLKTLDLSALQLTLTQDPR
jgi:alternate signal-mediated exported protein